MKKTNIFFGNQFVDSMYVGKSKWSVFIHKSGVFAKRLIVSLAMISFGGWMAFGGYDYATNTPPKGFIRPVEAQEVSSSTPASSEEDIPVLDRIMACESSTGQYGKDGQVIIHVNTDGSYDIGAAQVNSIWNATATKMGYDLSKENDNKEFARWLFLTHGSSPWDSSAKCWNH